MAKELKAGDEKLLQYLNEAYGKERELEIALEAHIAMTTKAPYKKRLQEHLKETKAHARGGRAPDQEDQRRWSGGAREGRRPGGRDRRSRWRRGRCTCCAAPASRRRC